MIEITAWHWLGFLAAVGFFLALDLGVFHRHAHVVRFGEALAWTLVWISLALGFAAALYFFREREEALEFLTGYIIELSLSMDNVFVIALIFAFFQVPLQFQHRVLFWGILGALVMRGVMIGAGTALIQRFHWLLYVLGGFLIITGVRMLFAGQGGIHPERNPVLKLARRFFPVSNDFDGQKFLTSLGEQRALTPLAVVLILVETTDLVFALDSIPAIFAVTQNAFIVFTSNVFAILGLRSLYFVLANAIEFFRYLKVGLSLVLVFIGVKMLIGFWDLTIPIGWALGIVAGIIVSAIGISVAAIWRERRRRP